MNGLFPYRLVGFTLGRLEDDAVAASESFLEEVVDICKLGLSPDLTPEDEEVLPRHVQPRPETQAGIVLATV
jgi:hypothetical protein